LDENESHWLLISMQATAQLLHAVHFVLEILFQMLKIVRNRM
jgi:hypothetical protein